MTGNQWGCMLMYMIALAAIATTGNLAALGIAIAIYASALRISYAIKGGPDA